MNIKEFLERGLLIIDGSYKVLDEYGNEYRNEDGCLEYLEISSKHEGQILAQYLQNKTKVTK